VIQLNSHGPDVADWQKFLRKQGFNPGPADSFFGGQTKTATIAFQKTNSMPMAFAETQRSASR